MQNFLVSGHQNETLFLEPSILRTSKYITHTMPFTPLSSMRDILSLEESFPPLASHPPAGSSGLSGFVSGIYLGTLDTHEKR